MPPYCFGMIMPEKTLVLDELPDLRRQIVQLVGDLPVVAHAAQFFDRPVDESLLLGAERRLREGEQLVPVRACR